MSKLSKSVQIKKEDDTTFNKLLELQTLLKKESALKELFIKTGIETQKNIEKQCIEIYEKKMEVLNILQRLNSQAPINSLDNNSKSKSSAQTECLKENILVKNNYDYLQVLNTYIPKLLNYLWEDPKLVAKLLVCSDIKDTEKYIAPFICNNFYENILSSNYIEDPLMYVIYLLLHNEINNIEAINNLDSFLNKTHCSCFLGQLIEKKDVKDFFKIILQNIMEDIGSEPFNFDIDDIDRSLATKKRKTIKKEIFEKDLEKKDTMKEKNTKRIKNPENYLSQRTFSAYSTGPINDDDKKLIKDNTDYQVFSAKYLVPITFSELEEKIKEAKDETLKDYYKYILLNANNDKNAYSQDNFIDSIADAKNSQVIFVLYQQDFVKATEFINKLFDNLNENYRIVPYAIKCVCKIISKLVMKKFPKANTIEKYLLISKFFFQILLNPILLKPDLNALINNYIISNNIQKNAKIVSRIINQFISFKLYKNAAMAKGGNYTPFNIYFLEKIPEVLKFFERIVKVKLPSFIDNLINDKISIDDYNYNYFKENPNEVLFHKSMLLNIDEFYAINKNIKNNLDKLLSIDKGFFEGDKVNEKNSKNKNNNNNNSNTNKELEKKNRLIKMSIDKINDSDNYKVLEDLVKHKDYTVIKKEEKKSEGGLGLFSKKKNVIEIKKQNIHYFHISELLFNEKYKKIFALEQKNPYYHIKEIKGSTDKKILSQNDIIKAKNFLSSILYNYRILVKSDFNEGTTNNTNDILRELKLFMKSTNFLIDNKIPSVWYVSALMECLKKLPREYKVNDNEKLYNELKDELIDSIKLYNFENMSIFIDKMKYANRNKMYFDKTKEIYIDIELNNRANNIIENDPINVNLYYKFTDKVWDFSIYKESIKEKQLDFLDSFTFKESSDKGRLCKTIEQFTKFFPNLNKRVSLEDLTIDENEIGIFELQKQIELPRKLKTFFNIVSDHLKNIIKNEKDLNTINNKIYDYVMSKIYARIFPKEKHVLDDQILQKLCKLSWIEPQHIINSKTQFDFELVLPDIINYFNLIRSEKSPRKKLLNLDNIFSSINRLLIFSSDATKIGVDDQMPILTYSFVKAKPFLIYTDCKFMQLYIGEKKNKGEDNQLTQMITICDFIKQVSAKSLFNVEEEEFNQKCQISFQEYMDNYLDN